MLVDGREAPLSLTVTGANRHDVTQLEAVLSAIVVKVPPQRRHKHLCADAAYAGAPAHAGMVREGYIPHVRGPWKEAHGERRDPAKKPRRWIELPIAGSIAFASCLSGLKNWSAAISHYVSWLRQLSCSEKFPHA